MLTLEKVPNQQSRGAGAIGQSVKTLLAAWPSLSKWARFEKPQCAFQI